MGSPIRVPESDDQNIKDILSPAKKSTKIVFDIVYTWFDSGASTNVVDPEIWIPFLVKTVAASLFEIGSEPTPERRSSLYVTK